MCIAIPMQVIDVESGQVLCQGRGEQRRVRTTLIGKVSQGDWLLIFIDDALEIIDAQKAHEINATLDLVQGAMLGFPASQPSFAADNAAAFDLPSRMSYEQLLALLHATPSSTPQENTP